MSDIEKHDVIVSIIGSVPDWCEGEIVRCRDCAYIIHFFHHGDERWQCTEPHQEGDDVKPDAYCWRVKRKEGDE